MRFAEVFLRLGSSLVAWMLLFAYFVWLAVLYVMGCGPDGDELHRLLLGLSPLAIGAAFLVQATTPFADIHRMLRWLGVPLLLLSPFCIRTIWSIFRTVNLDGAALCAAGEAPLWQQAWAPVAFVTVAVVALLVVRTWRAGGDAHAT